jgi:SAM domain (Sterile alpha motif)
MKRRSKTAGGKRAKARSGKASMPTPNNSHEASAHRSAATLQIAEWLKKLGLRQYAQRFAENDISFSILPDLTDQDLKEIGVSLGHRRQLLLAIAELTTREKEAPKVAVDRRNSGRSCGKQSTRASRSVVSAMANYWSHGSASPI